MKKILSEIESQKIRLEELCGESAAYIGYLESTVEDLKEANEEICKEQKKAIASIAALTKIKEELSSLERENIVIIQKLSDILEAKEKE